MNNLLKKLSLIKFIYRMNCYVRDYKAERLNYELGQCQIRFKNMKQEKFNQIIFNLLTEYIY